MGRFKLHVSVVLLSINRCMDIQIFNTRWIVCGLLTILLMTITLVSADQTRAEKTVSSEFRLYTPYCGLRCLYTVLRLANKDIEFSELLKPKYIGSREGSSLSELKKAAEDNGLHTTLANKLTSRELCQSGYPIILHVKSDVMSGMYDHFELFLGTKNGEAILYDPPNPIRSVPFRELAHRWNGNGLIISASPIDLNAIFAPARRRLMIYTIVAFVGLLALHRVKRWLPETMFNSRSKSVGLSIGQGSVFAIAALLCGMLYHFANDEGLLANANATASVQQAHQGNFIPKISKKKVRELLGSDAVFIDARLARDFKAGHLKGAISVPVDANDVERQEVTTDISKDACVVLYCQSSGCKYAEIVAIKLIDEGFSNISIYKGGWAEWVAKNGKPKGASL